MFSVDAHTRVYIASQPADFRRQIDGLSLMVQEVLELDPFSAHLFVFSNKGRDKLKLNRLGFPGAVQLFEVSLL